MRDFGVGLAPPCVAKQSAARRFLSGANRQFRHDGLDRGKAKCGIRPRRASSGSMALCVRQARSETRLQSPSLPARTMPRI